MLKYDGEAHEVQKVAVAAHVAQFILQTLQILLSEVSPNSLVFVQASSQVLVRLFPHFGEGHAVTQVEILK